MQFFDILFQRYADPAPLINGMIKTNRFEEFVFGFIDRYNEDKQEKNIWEFFLHKVIDQSYEDFRNSVSSSAPKKVEKEELTETVKKSFDMLKTFNPKG